MTPSVRAQIDLGAIEANLRVIRHHAPASAVLGMIKANAYGHGLVSIARFLSSRADALAVARADEALWLRDAGVNGRLVVMSGALSGQELDALLAANVDIMLHRSEQVDMLARAPLKQPVNVWIKYDSGMHRLGFDKLGLRMCSTRLDTLAGITQRVMLTHFASSDASDKTLTDAQWTEFLDATTGLPGSLSAANSAAVMRHPQTHADWVRPGIMLYGVSPISDETESGNPLCPAMTLSANLIAIREIPAGQTVGYGRTWTAARTTRVGTISIGYGDGYPRHARSGTPVVIGGRRVPLIGRVSMDLITVDLTEHPSAKVGDVAELWGKQLSVNEVAACSDTIGYELLTGISPRVRCEYLLPEVNKVPHHVDTPAAVSDA